MRKILIFSALALSLATAAVQADDSVRTAQEVLKQEGYYTGPVDGELNAATKAALRRYQMRNQLEPTGEITAETAAALNKGSQESPAEAPAAPQPAPSVPPAPLATPTPAAAIPPTPPPTEDNRETLRAPKGIPLPPAERPVPATGSDPAYAGLYARTPYHNAPAEVQRETLLRAQAILAKRGFFRGQVNGFPGVETEEALFRFQSSRDLPKSGRLDIDTLAELHLLPVSQPTKLKPRGPSGAVRGVPLD